MEKDVAKKLIQKSTISTSEDFTDKLLLKIESEKVIQPVSDVQHIRMYWLVIFGIVGIGAICFLLIFFGFFPKINLFEIQSKSSKTPWFVLTTLVLLLGTNHILKIQQLTNFQSKK